MDESVRTLVAEVFPGVERELFGRAFSLDEACGLVAAYMFQRYGVSNYQCGEDVKAILTGKLDTDARLLRASESGETPAWKPVS